MVNAAEATSDLREETCRIAPLNGQACIDIELLVVFDTLDHRAGNEIRCKGIITAEEDVGRVGQLLQRAQGIGCRREGGIVVQVLQVGAGVLGGLLQRPGDDEGPQGDKPGQVGSRAPGMAKRKGMSG